MKYFLLVLLSVLIFGCSSTKDGIMNYNFEKLSEYSINEASSIPKARVIVGNVYNYSRFGTQRSDIIARDVLLSNFKKNSNFTVIDDKNSNEFIENLGFLQPIDLDFVYLKQRFLGVDYIIIGNIIDYTLDENNFKSNVFSTEVEKAHFTLELEIIDINNGKIWSETGIGEEALNYSIASQDKDIISYGSLEKGAIEKAVENGIENFVKEIKKNPWSTTVIKKEGSKLYIQIEPNRILKKGTEFEVYQQGNIITYRDKVLGYEEELVGNVKVVSYEKSNIVILKYKGVDFLLPAMVKLK